MEFIDWGDKKITVRELTVREVLSILKALADADGDVPLVSFAQKHTNALAIPDDTDYLDLPYKIAAEVQAAFDRENEVFFSRTREIAAKGREQRNAAKTSSKPPAP